jgi:cytoskeletal protein RodZ
MQWTMPHRALQIVAVALVSIAILSFGAGVWNAPNRGRLPGERARGAEPGSVPAAPAVEATPLSQERIEGPPPAAELTPEEKAAQEEARQAKAQTDVTAKVAPAAQAAAPTAPAAPVPVAPSVETPASPPSDEAPH